MDIRSIANQATSLKDEGMVTQYKGRVAQIDSDGVMYHTAKPHITMERNFAGTVNYMTYILKQSGSESGNIHTTMGLKGGREQMAYRQPYQAGRASHLDPAYKKRVIDLRAAFFNWSNEVFQPAPQAFIEADDSMTMAQEARIRETGDINSSIIVTDDKDLNMAMGNLMSISKPTMSCIGDFVNGQWCNGFGHVDWKAPTGSKNRKMLGRGHKFFWAQLLAGDSVDNIEGLPFITGELANIYLPLKQRSASRPKKAVAGGTAVKLLSDVRTNEVALRRVRELYRGFFGKWGDFFVFENAFLLWMRRTSNPLDVLEFFKECGWEYQLHQQQWDALQKYQLACEEKMKEL